jgi:MoxR-like ATPase
MRYGGNDHSNAEDAAYMSLKLASEKIRVAVTDSCRDLVQRETLVELAVLGAVAQEHLLVAGPPGTANSEAVRRIARRLGGNYFEYLIGRFTEPGEIFGPVNLRKLKEGIVETETAGMLPEADIAFLDEVFLGSTAILNTLLSILNERRFRRGHTDLRCPLRLCVGACNHLPTDGQLAAFADRFLLRAFVEPIGDTGLEELLTSGWALSTSPAEPLATIADLDVLTASSRAMDITLLRPALAHGVRLLRGAGIELSDRRVVRLQRLIAAAAALSGREQPAEADLWPIIFALPTAEAQHLGRDVLREFLAASENATLLAAPLEGSLGARARAARILRDGTAIIEAGPENGAEAAWRLQVEGVAREIDASFTDETLPPDLGALRARIVEFLAQASSETGTH